MSGSGSGSVVWSGKPWILPSAVVRTVFVLVVAVVVVWLEFMFDVALSTAQSIPVLSSLAVVFWTILFFFVVWVFSLLHLLLLRATHLYILHDDSLEIRRGILTSKSFVVSPSGFSDLEVVRTVSGRIIESGDIIIRTQSETDSVWRMVNLRNPLKVGDQIRQVMSRPIVRIEGQQPPPKEGKQ